MSWRDDVPDDVKDFRYMLLFVFLVSAAVGAATFAAAFYR